MTKHKNIHLPYNEPVMEYHKVIARLAADYAPDNGRILDFGCGLGYISSLIREAMPEADIFAADIDKSCLNFTAERTSKVNLIQLKNGEGFTGVGKEYDICIMSHVLEHMYSPRDSVLDAVNLLKNGGHLILAVPNIVRPDIITHNIRRRNYVNKGHVCAWDRPHWINFLENICKVEVVEYTQDICPFFLRRFGKIAFIKYLERKTSKLLPWMCMSHIAVIKKSS